MVAVFINCRHIYVAEEIEPLESALAKCICMVWLKPIHYLIPKTSLSRRQLMPNITLVQVF